MRAKDGLRILWDRLRKRRPATASHADTARETGVMLGLMAQANAAGAAMTDEQRLLLIQAAPGMRAREAKLLAIPNRSSVEENELHMIRREMAAIEGRAAPQQPSRIRAFLGPMAAGAPWLAILGSPLTWIAAGLAAFGVQTVRIERLHHDLTETRRELAVSAQHLAEQAALSQRLAQQVTRADQDSAQSARNLEHEREIRLRAQAEAARIRHAIDQARTGAPVDYGFGGVQHDGTDSPPSGGASAPVGDQR